MKFAQMRRDNVVNFATRLTNAVRAVNPDLIISAALMPEGAYSGDYNVSGMDSVSFADLHYGQNYKDAARSLRLHSSHGIQRFLRRRSSVDGRACGQCCQYGK